MTELVPIQTIESMPPKSDSKFFIVIIILLVLLLGSLVSNFMNFSGKNPLVSSVPSGDKSSLFDSQSAMFTGKITKVENNKIWLENNHGVTGTAVLAPNYLVTDMEKLTSATPSGNLQQPEIELNKNAIISLQFINGEYQVTSISFIPSVGSPIVPNSVPASIPPAPSFVPLPSGPILPNPSATPSSR